MVVRRDPSLLIAPVDIIARELATLPVHGEIARESELPPAKAGGFWTKLCGFAIQGPIRAASRGRIPAFPCRVNATVPEVTMEMLGFD